MVSFINKFFNKISKSREELLLAKIDKDRIPLHVAIIMDGNGRWAKKRGLPRIAGHRAGAEAIRRIVEYSPEIGIEILTLN